MTTPNTLAISQPAISGNQEFLADLLAGLSKHPRTLPCKYFYDARGSELFQKICELPEYYLTRAELQILDRYASEMAKAVGPNIELIGLGTGAGTKTRILLEKLQAPVAYVPVDISKEQLQRSTKLFRKLFPELEILPVCTDYLEPVKLPAPSRKPARKIVYFPGSTIGNFEPQPAQQFLQRISKYVGNGGGLLVGVDLEKDRDVLERAYDDSAGVTAQFNLNLLARANRELGADFDLKQWRHHAVYNSAEGRIEIYLESQTEQSVHVGGKRFDFAADEKITTEYSYKYTPKRFTALAGKAGFKVKQMWSDDAHLFGVFYFTVLSSK
jgi:dimethylhistidine N-methyltransferase